MESQLLNVLLEENLSLLWDDLEGEELSVRPEKLVVLFKSFAPSIFSSLSGEKESLMKAWELTASFLSVLDLVVEEAFIKDTQALRYSGYALEILEIYHGTFCPVADKIPPGFWKKLLTAWALGDDGLSKKAWSFFMKVSIVFTIEEFSGLPSVLLNLIREIDKYCPAERTAQAYEVVLFSAFVSRAFKEKLLDVLSMGFVKRLRPEVFFFFSKQICKIPYSEIEPQVREFEKTFCCQRLAEELCGDLESGFPVTNVEFYLPQEDKVLFCFSFLEGNERLGELLELFDQSEVSFVSLGFHLFYQISYGKKKVSNWPESS